MQPWQQLALLSLVAAALMAAAYRLLPFVYRTPKEREYKRRVFVNTHGRIGDAIITDVHEHILYYSYELGGVEYAAAQDITQLIDCVPGELERLVGPVSLKYAPNNPANSIVLCEGWSGLRAAKPSPTEAPA